MAKTCSLELEKKVMEYIKEGKRKMEAAKVFRLNRKTIYRWEKRQREISSDEAITFPQQILAISQEQFVANHFAGQHFYEII
jgi:transposase